MSAGNLNKMQDGIYDDMVQLDPKNNAFIDNNKNKLNPEIERYENLRKYSTDEVFIGFWLDGKSLYRKVVHIPNCDQVKNTGVIKTGINWDIVTNVEGFYINTNGSQVFFNSYVTPEAFVRIVPSSTKGNFDISAGSSYTGNPLDTYLIVEFTKDES